MPRCIIHTLTFYGGGWCSDSMQYSKTVCRKSAGYFRLKQIYGKSSACSDGFYQGHKELRRQYRRYLREADIIIRSRKLP